MELSTPLSSLARVGTVTTRNLKKLGLETVGDLLLYFPFRYDDFSQSLAIDSLQAGQTVNITGVIELIQNKRSPRRRMYITEALINDGTETIRAIWFNQPFLTRTLKPGDEVSLSGRVGEDYGGLLLTSPVYEKLGAKAVHTQGIVPVYHLIATVSQKQLRGAIAQIIGLADTVRDWLPEDIRRAQDVESLGSAIRQIHFPDSETTLRDAKQRLGFNELLLVQLRAQRQRREFLQLSAPVIRFHEKETKSLVAGLPFKLTNDQKNSAWEIIQDLGRAKPMVRLLQGDVGSGKTAVAALALLNAALDNQQAALMVPTEILAFQHFNTFGKTLFKDQPIVFCLLTSSYQLIKRPQQAAEKISKAALLDMIAQGAVSVILGTHALLQEKVVFHNLSLAVIDEQHRFGVEQRSLLAAKAGGDKIMPHLLSMTATPIPRSLALALYGDLDISLVKQMPLGRKKIITKVAGDKEREEIYRFIESELEAGRQAFVICPLIDPSDTLGAKSVKAEFERLDTTVFKKHNIGLIHGRLKAAEREKIMAEFAAGTIQLLVATSVIEIGIDIPSASVMLIENADRFGLAQLHQYRGRVGRSDQQSYCFLMSEIQDQTSLTRLNAMSAFDSGFDLARADLQFRGPGEVYGLAQKGFPELKMANFYDVELIKKAREAAIALLDQDANLQKYPELKKELGDWEERAHLE